MSERVENGYVALVITCVVGLLCIALVSWTIPYSKGYERANQDHQAEYASDQTARERREECASAASAQEAIECYDEAQATTRENQRAEQDLDAQRQMANWAEGMLWATTIVGCLTIAVTGLGAYWVKETLAATRGAVRAADDAVQVTREIGQMETRAYVTVSKSRYVTGKYGVFIEIVLRNIGKTPARRARVNGILRFTHLESGNQNALSPYQHINKFEAFAGVVEPGETAVAFYYIPHTEFEERIFFKQVMGNRSGDVDCEIIWSDVFDIEHTERHILGRLGNESLPTYTFDDTDTEVILSRSYTGWSIDQEMRDNKRD